jgi:segregation and condensation protein B
MTHLPDDAPLDETADPPADREADLPPTATETAPGAAHAGNGLESVRMAEALLFAASEPLDEESIRVRLPEGADVKRVIADLVELYRPRGVNLVKVAGRWQFRTAPDLKHLLERHITQTRKLSRAAVETLAIVAYHQPVSRADIEDIRGVSLSKGSLEVLLETGWVIPKGRRESPGKPVIYGTSATFLEHFGLMSIKDLPGLDELKATGLLNREPPAPSLLPIAGGQSDDPDNAPDDADDADTDEGDDDDLTPEGSEVIPLKPR